MISKVLIWLELKPRSDDPDEKGVFSDKVELLYSNSSVSLTMSLINAVIVAVVEWYKTTPQIVGLWFACLATVIALRSILVSRYYASDRSDTERWARLFCIGSTLMGVIWGSAGILFFFPEDSIYLSFLSFVLGGMAAGAVVVLSSLKGIAVLFILPLLLPIAYSFLSQGDPISFGMSLLVCSYLGTLIFSSRRIGLAIDRSMVLNFENQHLLTQVHLEKMRAQEFNSDLLEEIELRTRAQKELRNAASLLTQQNRQLDLALKHAQHVSEAKSSFLAMVSHEIRTPMNAIMGMTDVLIDGTFLVEQRRNLEIIRDSAGQLLTIMNDILDLSRIEAGKMELLSEPFSMKEMVEDVIDLFQLNALEKKIEIHSVFVQEPPKQILGDLGRLRQILINLIGNAIKFCHEGGAVLCVTDIVEQPDQNYACTIAVADTGIGIPPDKLEAIFESFNQGETYVTRRYGGTGLGLTISQQLVQLMGGKISVISKVGLATRFTVELKLGNVKCEWQPESPIDTVTSDLSSPLKLNILVAEDNVVNQKLFQNILSKLGCTVKVVGNGVEAIQAVEGESFDLILMDCQMPVLDGYETTRQLRSHDKEEIKNIPIVAITAHAFEADREKCREAGMNSYLSKPIQRKELTKTLRKFSTTH